jgi:hypothetical protein
MGPMHAGRRRFDMIRWGEARRAADAGFFARKVVAAASARVMIVSDARRPSDLEFFQQGAAAGQVQPSPITRRSPRPSPMVALLLLGLSTGAASRRSLAACCQGANHCSTSRTASTL